MINNIYNLIQLCNNSYMTNNIYNYFIYDIINTLNKYYL